MGINNLKKVIFFILLSVSLVIVACSNSVKEEKSIEITPEEWGEIARANDYCNTLSSLGTIDDWDECRDSRLSWSTESKYKKFKAQQEAKSQQATELNQKQSDVDDKISNIEGKLQKGIEVKFEEYWNLDKLKEFKPKLNAELELPVDKISTAESKEDDIRVFYLVWKKEDVLNGQEQIKADFISSLRKAVQEIKNTGEFELIIVSTFEGDLTNSTGNFEINVFKVNEATDYSQVVTSGSGIFKR